jgi:hypothetical protein
VEEQAGREATRSHRAEGFLEQVAFCRHGSQLPDWPHAVRARQAGRGFDRAVDHANDAILVDDHDQQARGVQDVAQQTWVVFDGDAGGDHQDLASQ